MKAYNWFCVFSTLCSTRLGTTTENPIVFPGDETIQTRSFNDPLTFNGVDGEIPIQLARMLSNVTSEAELINVFLEPKNRPFAGDILGARFGGGPMERKALTAAKMATCIPEPTIVQLKPETAPASTFYYPPCTRVPRCGGCCSHSLLACQPTEVETLQLGVIISEYRSGSQLAFKDKAIITVEKHKSCRCDCKVKAEHCNPYQKYDRVNCACECTNKDKQRKCREDEFELKLWDPKICACSCREIKDCSSNYYFDKYTCQCVPERPRRQNVTDADRYLYNVN